jgi:hypothetical protein
MVRQRTAIWQQRLLALALAAWIALGAAHVAIVMTGPGGWRPDRRAPGAAAVIGHSHDTDARNVAGPMELTESGAGERMLLIVPSATDSADLLYTRFQLAHLLYPRRVAVRRAPGPAAPRPDDVRSAFVVAPGVALPQDCRASADALGFRLLECAAP